MMNLFENSFLILAVLVFVAVLLLLEALYVMWRAYRGPEATKLQSRLQALSSTRDHTQQTQLLKQRMLSEMPMLERYIQSIPRIRVLDRNILQSGLNWTVSKFLMGSLVMAAIGWFAISGALHQSMAMGAIGALVIGSLPFLYIQYKKNQRMSKMERQLPEALDLIGRALRAGHAFSASLKMVGEEMAEPLAGEFRIVHDEINFGVSMQQSLTHLSERVPLTDLRYFVVAVLIQRESGGNLTEILDKLSQLIRERLKLMARVKVLSSEGRMSAWILGLMPFLLAALINAVNPDFMRPLWTDPMGIAIVKYMLILMLIGAVIMRKIVKIRY